MSTLTYVFIIALCAALILTPLVRRFALGRGMVQHPTARGSHTEPKPRIGGVAIFFSFILALVASIPLQTNISELLIVYRYLAIFGGASLMFGTGLIDDVYGLKPSTKLLSQLIAGLITWYGGVQINVLSVTLYSGVEIGWLSLPVTLFWIVLVTNAINLIDGLDGLAAGVVLFVSLMMTVLCVVNQNYLVAIGFISLAGATLGFLRYNFNPASIFMGDSGSYFLGYAIATLSVMGSVKGQTTVAILIPFLALGVPIFDALLSPLRRFARGKKIFTPDHNHLHHKIMESGEGHRNTVLIIYSVTIILSAAAFSMVYVRDEKAALILLIPAAVLFFLFRKIGYLNYFAIDKLYGWLTDITESTKISGQSRTFLDHQIEVSRAKTIDEVWEAATGAFSFLDLDLALLKLSPSCNFEKGVSELYNWNSENAVSPNPAMYRFKIEYPLFYDGDQQAYLGRLIIHKNTRMVPIRQFTIRRIEQLQRDITQKISEILVRQPTSGTSQRQQTTPIPTRHILKN
jgi:UDP-GlcNAc:undecaprenyl-phosphate GlcNAc-1-phosphate transferase